MIITTKKDPKQLSLAERGVLNYIQEKCSNDGTFCKSAQQIADDINAASRGRLDQQTRLTRLRVNRIILRLIKAGQVTIVERPQKGKDESYILRPKFTLVNSVAPQKEPQTDIPHAVHSNSVETPLVNSGKETEVCDKKDTCLPDCKTCEQQENQTCEHPHSRDSRVSYSKVGTKEGSRDMNSHSGISPDTKPVPAVPAVPVQGRQQVKASLKKGLTIPAALPPKEDAPMGTEKGALLRKVRRSLGTSPFNSKICQCCFLLDRYQDSDYCEHCDQEHCDAYSIEACDGNLKNCSLQKKLIAQGKERS
jgi:hypothetical protein